MRHRGKRNHSQTGSRHAQLGKHRWALLVILLTSVGIVTACASSPPPAASPAIVPPSATALTSPTGAPDILLPTTTPNAGGEMTAIGLVSVASELDRPVFVTHAGDGSGRLFILERGGTARVLHDGELADAPWLDIADRVNDGSAEQGLLGLAFAPDFAESGHFYVNYTGAAGKTTVSRFTVDDPAAAIVDPATERVILTVDQPASNHNGGMLAFGPDGYLYIGMGDGGAANDRFGNGQNPNTLLGKMLRIDVRPDASPGEPYAIPVDNPWIEMDWQGADVRDEIWAVGLRNPWRFSFDRATGDLWIGDVGQGAYEEINHTPAQTRGPLNYGWPIMEGKQCFPDNAQCDQTGLTLPLLDYTHAGNCSVTGGYVYRGAAYPELDGAYLYGDYCSGKIWGLLPEAEGWRNELLLQSDLRISSFGEDETGELYVIDLSGGDVYRIVLAD